jgi:hypothetical protein
MTTPTYEINYSRETGDFDVFINDEYIGSRATYWAGQELVDEQLTILAEFDAQTVEPALPAPVQAFLTTLDDTPALPAVFTATSAEPLDAMLQALSQAESLINRLGEDVISQTDEVTISVCGQPLTTVVVVVAPRVAVEAVPIRTQEAA